MNYFTGLPLKGCMKKGPKGGGGGRLWGCGVVKNGLPGVAAIFFNTVTTHQSFFLLV